MLKISHFCGEMSEQTHLVRQRCRNNLQVKNQVPKLLSPVRPLHQPFASFQLRKRDKHSRLSWTGSEIKGGRSGVTRLSNSEGRGSQVKCDQN